MDGWDRVAVFADSDYAASYESCRSTTGTPMAPMLMLLKTLMDGTATVPLLARLYQ